MGGTKNCVRFYEKDGIRMQYGKAGDGTKNFVILPGLSVQPVAGAAASLKNQYKEILDNGYTLWIFDRRENVSEGYTFSEMAEDTVKTIQDLGIEKTDLFGASQGGMMALYIAENYPELVNRLTLGCTGARVTDMLRQRLNSWHEMAAGKDRRSLDASFVDWMLGQKTAARYREYLISQKQEYREKDWRHFEIMLRTFDSMEIERDLGKIGCPVLAVGCLGDRVIGHEATEDIQQKLGCEMYMFGPEYGHAVYDETPEFVRIISGFLRAGKDSV